MQDTYIIGAASTSIGKKPNVSYKALTREVYLSLLADAGMSDGRDIGSAWFGNCTLHLENQSSIRGQVCLSPLVQDGLFPSRVPVVNIDNACASSSTALNGACKDVLVGDVPLSMAIGVEKLYQADPARRSFDMFNGAFDQLDPEPWRQYYREAAVRAGRDFDARATHAITMDTYAIQAAYHMRRFGTTARQLAIAASQTHNFGADNELAQYRFRMTPEEVLADRPVSFPLTRAMCAPMGDGAAALLVCSRDYLRSCPPAVQERAVRVRASVLSGGVYRDLDAPSLTWTAARRAYDVAGVAPTDIDVAEVHDATSFSVVYQAEMMGFCGIGQGGPFVESGACGPGGTIPMNTSGGLVSKGHPVGATGASMIFELVRQLRGEAGVRQVPGARLALAENGGGVMGFDEAVCAVTILERD